MRTRKHACDDGAATTARGADAYAIGLQSCTSPLLDAINHDEHLQR